MRFVFIRHGHRVKGQDALTPAGRDAALAAGRFLREHGIAPELLCHTDSRRTRETAQLVAQVAAPDCALLDVGTGFAAGASAQAVQQRIQGWLQQHGKPAQVVAFVGHDPQQVAVGRALAGGRIAVPKANRACALVFDLEAGAWLLGPSFLGTPETP